jgi:regulator of protease activity HflC (stomatin/prohibitin superfamily)
MNEVIIGFFGALIFEVVVLAILRFFHFYVIVQERRSHIYVLFGEVVAEVSEPGIHFLWPKLTWRALLMSWLGRVYVLDLSMDQTYLRNQHVNSEEGAPMGVGIWYEMFINDPISFLFKNADPTGSLSANVSNATVRALSNLPLAKLLEERHSLSSVVRNEVTNKSQDWGYKLGSVYIRKVQFNDTNMIREIEGKVVNRLRQVTASIKQDGENQVNIITNTAQRMASIEFGKAAAIRPELFGKALEEISKDQDVAKALFEILEAQGLLASQSEIILLPEKSQVLQDIVAGM